MTLRLPAALSGAVLLAMFPAGPTLAQFPGQGGPPSVGVVRAEKQPITETHGDGKYYLALRPGEFVAAVRSTNTKGLRSAYDKIRIRRSIEYPVTGVAAALAREGEHVLGEVDQRQVRLGEGGAQHGLLRLQPAGE